MTLTTSIVHIDGNIHKFFHLRIVVSKHTQSPKHRDLAVGEHLFVRHDDGHWQNLGSHDPEGGDQVWVPAIFDDDEPTADHVSALPPWRVIGRTSC